MITYDSIYPFSVFFKDRKQFWPKYKTDSKNMYVVVMEYGDDTGKNILVFPAAVPYRRVHQIYAMYPGQATRVMVSSKIFRRNTNLNGQLTKLIMSNQVFKAYSIRDKNDQQTSLVFFDMDLEDWKLLSQFINPNNGRQIDLPPLEKIKTMDFPNKNVNQFLMEHAAELRNKMDSFNPWHKVPDPKAYGRKINSTVAAEWFSMSNRELYEMINAWNLKIWKSSRVNKTKFLVSYNELIMFRRKLNYLNRQMKKGMIPMNKSVEKVRLNLHLSTNNVWELRNELSEHKMNYDEFIGYLLKEHHRDESKVSDDVPEYNELAKSINQMNKNIIAMQKEIQNLEQQFADLIDINNDD